MKLLKIDWERGAWRVSDAETSTLLGKYEQLSLVGVNGELVLTHGGRHGWLVVVGNLIERGKSALIVGKDSVINQS